MEHEFERAYTGRAPRKGLHPVAVVALVLAGLMLAGTAAAGVGAWLLVRKVSEVTERVRQSPATVAGQMLARLDPGLRVVDTDDRAGTVTLRNVGTGQESTVSFQDIVEGALRLRTAEGSLTLDFRGNEREGSGSLVVTTPEGTVRVQGRADPEGGSLVIRSPEGEAHFGAGASAEPLPDWITVFRGPRDPRHVYSASSSEGAIRGVAWETDASAGRVADFYEQWLEGRGFEIRSERYSERGRDRQTAVWGRTPDDRRTLFVVAVPEGEATKVLLTYAEKR